MTFRHFKKSFVQRMYCAVCINRFEADWTLFCLVLSREAVRSRRKQLVIRWRGFNYSYTHRLKTILISLCILSVVMCWMLIKLIWCVSSVCLSLFFIYVSYSLSSCPYQLIQGQVCSHASLRSSTELILDQTLQDPSGFSRVQLHHQRLDRNQEMGLHTSPDWFLLVDKGSLAG